MKARIIALGWIATLPLAGQIGGLATNDNGRVLYFSSVFRQRNTSQPFKEKLFRWRGGAVELYGSLERQIDAQESRFTNFYRLHTPQLSGDGNVLAYTGRRDCLAGSFCVYKERDEGVVLGGGVGERHAIGEARLSRNGRYALFVGIGPASEFYRVSSLLDLSDGASQRFPGAFVNFGYSAQAVADDGSVVYARYGSPPQLLLWSPAAGEVVLPTTGVPGNAVIDAAARVIVYDAWIEADAPRRLYALSRAAGNTVLLATDAERATITRDGAQVSISAVKRPAGRASRFSSAPTGRRSAWWRACRKAFGKRSFRATAWSPTRSRNTTACCASM